MFDDVIVADVVLDGEMPEKATRAFVGVDFSVRVRGILEIALIACFFGR